MNFLKKEQRFTWLSYFIMVYMIMASSWWGILLFMKNRQAYDANMSLMHLRDEISKHPDFQTYATSGEDLEALKTKFRKQRNMIQGESIFLLISIIACVFIINKANAERLSLANRQRNFILAVSHELKSPLTVIQMVLETLQRKPVTPEQMQLLTSNGMTETKRLSRLVDNILLIARQEYTRNENIHVQDVMPFVRNIIENQQLLNPHREILLTTTVGELPLRIDHQDMNHLLNNLLDNAIKYSPADKPIEVHIEQTATHSLVRVIDAGIGIPDAEKNNIFEVFYRVGSEEVRTSKGTGLGLFITQAIMRMNGGKVTVSDNHPTGTVFTLHFQKPINA